MNTTVKALLDLYVQLGGSLTDTYADVADGASVGNYTVIPDCIEAIKNVVSGGGGSELPEVTTDDNGSVLTVVEGEWDKAAPIDEGEKYAPPIWDLSYDEDTCEFSITDEFGETLTSQKLLSLAEDNTKNPVLIRENEVYTLASKVELTPETVIYTVRFAYPLFSDNLNYAKQILVYSELEEEEWQDPVISELSTLLIPKIEQFNVSISGDNFVANTSVSTLYANFNAGNTYRIKVQESVTNRSIGTIVSITHGTTNNKFNIYAFIGSQLYSAEDATGNSFTLSPVTATT